MDQLGKTSRHHWKERLKIRTIAKFESDLLKTYEDIVPQNCENLQTFVSWGGGGGFVPPSIQTSVKFLDLEELYLHQSEGELTKDNYGKGPK